MLCNELYVEKRIATSHVLYLCANELLSWLHLLTFQGLLQA